MPDIAGVSHIVDSIHGGRYVYLLLALVFVGFNFLSEPIRWRIYISKSKEIGFLRYFYIFSFTAMSSYMLPLKLGIPFRIFLLKEKAFLSLKHIISLMAFDGLLYYFLWVIAAGVATLFIFGKSSIPLNPYYVLGIASTLLFIMVFRSHLLNNDHFLTMKIRFISNKLKETAAIIRDVSPRQYLGSSAVVFLDIVSHVFRHYFIFKLVDIEITLGDVTAITVISVFAGMASMMPMGLIGYDASIVLLLKKSGVPLETALLIPLVNRSFSIIVSVILGVGSAAALGYTPFNGVRQIRERIARK